MSVKKYCPNCGSTDVEIYTRTSLSVYEDYFPSSWECNNCNYNGAMPEAEEDSIPDKEAIKTSSEGKFEDQHLPYSHYSNRYYKITLFIIVSAFLAYLGFSVGKLLLS